MRAPRLLLTILLPMIGGALAGWLFRGDLGGAWAGMVGGMFVGIMVAALLFAAETVLNKRHPATPFVVGLLAAAVAFVLVQTAFRPPDWVVYRQHFGGERPESVENVHGTIVYARENFAIFLRFDVAPEDLPALLAYRELEPATEDESLTLELERFEVPAWWDVQPVAEHVDHYRTIRDYAGAAEHDYADAPPMDEEHIPAHAFFAQPGQLFYDRDTETAYFVVRSYWTAEAEPAD